MQYTFIFISRSSQCKFYFNVFTVFKSLFILSVFQSRITTTVCIFCRKIINGNETHLCRHLDRSPKSTILTAQWTSDDIRGIGNRTAMVFLRKSSRLLVDAILKQVFAHGYNNFVVPLQSTNLWYSCLI